MPDLLLIQPLSGELPFAVPVGVIGLVNRTRASRRGVYAWELRDADLDSARVCAIPIHWAYSLPPAIDLARRIRRSHPGVRLIAGGYMVDLLGPALFEEAPFNYLLVGDAEEVFPALVESLVRDETPGELPNVIPATEPRESTRRPLAAALSGTDSIAVDWFPTLARVSRRVQGLAVPTYIHPWLEWTRGCPAECGNCLGSMRHQRLLSGRDRPTVLEADEAAEQLRRIRAAGLRWCHFTSDFVAIAGLDWSRRALRGRSDLTAYYESYDIPSREKTDLLCSSFAAGVLGVFLDQCPGPGGSADPDTWRSLEAVADALPDGWRLLLYSTDRGRGTPTPAIRKRAWFKYYRSSDVDDLVPGAVPPLPALVRRLAALTPRLRRQNRILARLMLLAPWLFPFLWRLSERRAFAKSS